MQEVQERSSGVWSPSPGSVYPALQQLEDEGLIRSEQSDGRKLFALTDAGEEFGVSGGAVSLGKTMREVAFAFMQVMRTGSETQIEAARDVLASARRDLYRILADGESDGSGDSESNGPAQDA